MKKLIDKLRKRKLFYTTILFTILSFILGVLLLSILSVNDKELVTNSVTNLFVAISDNKLKYSEILIRSLLTNNILNIIIWLLGISIIGIPIVIIILSIKSFIIGFTFTSIIYTYKFKGIIKALIYIIPHILNLFIIFILAYYSLNFSITIFNLLFKKREINKKNLTSKYIKLLILSTASIVVTSLIETYLIPNILRLINL